ncbi:ORFd [Enterobacteria phage PR772]|uniref:ORFd n=1 Tax=Enterobacteria phage PR772 TaxID=261665 RepID=Q6EDX9_9VIRU|nr:ORFd [Enterobacteria phage PR772]
MMARLKLTLKKRASGLNALPVSKAIFLCWFRAVLNLWRVIWAAVKNRFLCFSLTSLLRKGFGNG